MNFFCLYKSLICAGLHSSLRHCFSSCLYWYWQKRHSVIFLVFCFSPSTFLNIVSVFGLASLASLVVLGRVNFIFQKTGIFFHFEMQKIKRADMGCGMKYPEVLEYFYLGGSKKEHMADLDRNWSGLGFAKGGLVLACVGTAFPLLFFLSFDTYWHYDQASLVKTNFFCFLWDGREGNCRSLMGLGWGRVD